MWRGNPFSFSIYHNICPLENLTLNTTVKPVLYDWRYHHNFWTINFESYQFYRVFILFFIFVWLSRKCYALTIVVKPIFDWPSIWSYFCRSLLGVLLCFSWFVIGKRIFTVGNPLVFQIIPWKKKGNVFIIKTL